MRIVAGIWKGHALQVPKTIRPTMDRVREALFNIIDVQDASFLDLFAGSGAVAMEALSRGAARAVCVEKNPHVFKILKANRDKWDIGPLTLYNRDVLLFVKNPPEGVQTEFDYIFMDPPYHHGIIEPLIQSITQHMLLQKPHGTLIYEHEAGALPDELKMHLSDYIPFYKTYIYGSSHVSFFRW